MLSVFDLVTQDNYDLNFKLLAITTGKTWLAALFVIPVVIFGAFAILNLFLAMLLSHMERMDLALSAVSFRGSMSLRQGFEHGSGRTSDPGSARNSSHTRLLPIASNQIMPQPSNATISPQPSKDPINKTHYSSMQPDTSQTLASSKSKVKSLAKISVEMASTRMQSQDEVRLTPGIAGLCQSLDGKSLGFMGPRNNVRIWTFDLMRRRTVNWFMNAVIILSCIVLCFDDVTVQPGSIEDKVIHAFNIALVIIFGLEVS